MVVVEFESVEVLFHHSNLGCIKNMLLSAYHRSGTGRPPFNPLGLRVWRQILKRHRQKDANHFIYDSRFLSWTKTSGNQSENRIVESWTETEIPIPLWLWRWMAIWSRIHNGGNIIEDTLSTHHRFKRRSSRTIHGMRWRRKLKS